MVFIIFLFTRFILCLILLTKKLTSRLNFVNLWLSEFSIIFFSSLIWQGDSGGCVAIERNGSGHQYKTFNDFSRLRNQRATKFPKRVSCRNSHSEDVYIIGKQRDWQDMR